MAFVYPAGQIGMVFRVSLRQIWLNQRLLNTYTYVLTANPSGTDIAGIATGMDTVFSGAANLYPTHTALRDLSNLLESVAIQVIHPTRYLATKIAKNISGDYVISCDTANLAAVIERRGVEANRKNISTLHIPVPIDSTVILNGEFTAAYQAKLDAHAAIVQTDVTTATGAILKPCIFHPKPPAGYSLIGAAFRQPSVRVMRRRTLFVGE